MSEARKILEDFLGKRPSDLEGESEKLFNAIMKVADENDLLRDKIHEIKSFIHNEAYIEDEEHIMNCGMTICEIKRLEMMIDD